MRQIHLCVQLSSYLRADGAVRASVRARKQSPLHAIPLAALGSL